MTMKKDGFKTQIRAFDDNALAEAVAALRSDAPVALPTETVYGLAANAQSADAVAEIYRAKNRPSFNPLIVHVLDSAAAAQIGEFSEHAKKLAKEFWPGPLTMVLPITPHGREVICPAVTAGLDTIALRCPAHPAMRAVLDASGLPLAAPSANASGAISPTIAQHVAASLDGRIGLVLDGGSSEQGLESTIISVDDAGWTILRPGPISAEQIGVILQMPQNHTALDKGSITAPGQLASHYAPTKSLRLNAVQAEADEWLIGFGDVPGDDNLSARGDMAEAAARLYAALHKADAAPKARIAIAPIARSGIGLAINDRLQRAAH
jgi:L-threonylcarbamoyladenylate synthase